MAKNHRGEEIGVKDNRLIRVPGVSSDELPHRDRVVDHHNTPLAELLASDDIDHVLNGVPASIVRRIGGLNRGSSSSELEAAISSIPDVGIGELVRRVFLLLLAGNFDGAQAHIDRSRGIISAVDEIDPLLILEVEDGEEVHRLRVGSPEYGKWLLESEKRSTWQDWFLFLASLRDRFHKRAGSARKQTLTQGVSCAMCGRS